MKLQRGRALAAALLLLASRWAAAAVLNKVKTIGTTVVHYKVVLPARYHAGTAYPGILAFGGYGQTMDVVQGALRKVWREQAEKRGYIVVSPAAPDGGTFFEGGEHIFPEFFKVIFSEYRIQGNKFHVAGWSNGGISAFHIASLHPQFVWSVTGFPGYLPDGDSVAALADLCINMHVGELDSEWRPELEKQAAQFQKLGYSTRFTVEKGQSHRIETLAGEGAVRLFNQFDEAKQGCGK